MLPAADTDQQERYAIRPVPTPVLGVVGSEQVFPVGRVFCIGRNYAEHAVEMGHDPDRELPFFFSKPPNAVVPTGASSTSRSPRRTFTTRSSSSSRSAQVGATCPSTERSTSSTVMASGST